jgi:hypothetical protein
MRWPRTLLFGLGSLESHEIEAVAGVISAARPPHIHGAGRFIGRTGERFVRRQAGMVASEASQPPMANKFEQNLEQGGGILHLIRGAAEPPPTGGPKPSLLSLIFLRNESIQVRAWSMPTGTATTSNRPHQTGPRRGRGGRRGQSLPQAGDRRQRTSGPALSNASSSAARHTLRDTGPGGAAPLGSRVSPSPSHRLVGRKR